MAKRSEHLFQFSATQIENAALEEAKYHEARAEYWKKELEESKQKVKDTAKVTFREHSFTGGSRLDVGVDIGDVHAHRRMQESQEKIRAHVELADDYRISARLYGSQQPAKTYELDGADVAYFRLGGEPRPD